jgi:hypothetical protein
MEMRRLRHENTPAFGPSQGCMTFAVCPACQWVNLVCGSIGWFPIMKRKEILANPSAPMVTPIDGTASTKKP